MTDLVREIEEEVQRDEITEFLKKWWMLFAGLLFALVAGVAGYLYYQVWQDQQAVASQQQFSDAVSAVQEGDLASGMDSLEQLAQRSDGYGLQALFELAKLKIERGDLDSGLADYDRIALSSSFRQHYRDLSGILGAMALIQGGELSRADQRLAPLAASSGDFANKAEELLAISAHEAGDLCRAKDGYQALVDRLGGAEFSLVPLGVNVAGIEEQIRQISAQADC